MKRLRIVHQLYSVGWLLCMLVVWTGCQRSRTSTGGAATLKAEAERYEAAAKNVFKYDGIQSKVKLTYNGKSLNGVLRMERDKFLSLSVNAPLLGFEVARIEVSEDSVLVVDKLDKMYVSESWAEVRKNYADEASLEALQCLFLGRMYVPGRGQAVTSDFKRFAWTTMVDGTLLGDYTQNAKYLLSYAIDPNNHLQQMALSVAGRDLSVRWSYTNYVPFADVAMTQREVIDVSVGDKTFKGELTWGTPALSAGGWNRFTPGSNYKKVTTSQLLEAVKKMK